jgi:hypothetical protein
MHVEPGNAKYVPNHQLIIPTAVNMIRILSREHIIRNIASHVVHIVLPLQRRRHALHIANDVSLVQDLACVRIALDIVLGAVPGPLCAPFNARTRSTVVVCALRTGSCGTLAPKVVEDFISIGGVVCVLRAEGNLLLDLADFADGWGTGFRGKIRKENDDEDWMI